MKLVIDVSSRAQATKMLDHIWAEFPTAKARLDNGAVRKKNGSELQWDLILDEVPIGRTVHVIHIIRKLTHCSLKEAKDACDGAPMVLMQNLDQSQYELVAAQLRDTGATIARTESKETE